MMPGRKPTAAAARVALVLLMLCTFLGPASARRRNMKPAIKQGPVVPVRWIVLLLWCSTDVGFRLLLLLCLLVMTCTLSHVNS